jgi:hypothetical protein
MLVHRSCKLSLRAKRRIVLADCLHPDMEEHFLRSSLFPDSSVGRAGGCHVRQRPLGIADGTVGEFREACATYQVN